MEIIDFAMPSKHIKAEIQRRFTIRVEEHDGNENQNVFSPRRKMIILQTSVSRTYPYKDDAMLAVELDRFLWKKTRPEDKEWVEKMFGPKLNEPIDEYLDVEYLSKKEELVFAAAHEFYHVKGYLHALKLIRKSKEKAISEDKYNEIMSDRKADMYAIKKQMEWRKLHN